MDAVEPTVWRKNGGTATVEGLLNVKGDDEYARVKSKKLRSINEPTGSRVGERNAKVKGFRAGNTIQHH